MSRRYQDGASTCDLTEYFDDLPFRRISRDAGTAFWLVVYEMIGKRLCCLERSMVDVLTTSQHWLLSRTCKVGDMGKLITRDERGFSEIVSDGVCDAWCPPVAVLLRPLRVAKPDILKEHSGPTTSK